MGEDEMTELNQVINADCMDIMKHIPDKYFELAIVDPPYNLEKTGQLSRMNGSGKLKGRAINMLSTEFDREAIHKDYFKELFRVSKNQIIWGGNYFNLPTTRGFVIWDKEQPFENFSACEFAWTSFDTPAKIYREATTRTGEIKIHPTQKSIKLYKYLLHYFADPNDKILDTHAGSCSSVIACIDMGFEYLAIEKDKDYFDKATERINKELIKIKMFS